jgi:hypothetical protein
MGCASSNAPSGAANTLLPAPAHAGKKISDYVEMLERSNLDEVKLTLRGLSDESRSKLAEATSQIERPSKSLAECAANLKLIDLSDPVMAKQLLDAIRALELRIEAVKAELARDQLSKDEPVCASGKETMLEENVLKPATGKLSL